MNESDRRSNLRLCDVVLNIVDVESIVGAFVIVNQIGAMVRSWVS
jgi:hypothetical protein